MKPEARRAREIAARIRSVLLESWDPIGVVDVPEVQDEHDGYVGGIHRLLASGCSVSELMQHLNHIEPEKLGLVPHPVRARTTAVRLMEIDVRIETRNGP